MDRGPVDRGRTGIFFLDRVDRTGLEFVFWTGWTGGPAGTGIFMEWTGTGTYRSDR